MVTVRKVLVMVRSVCLTHVLVMRSAYACIGHMISSIHDVMALQLCMPESWLITLTNLVSERKEIAACHRRGSVSCLLAQNLLDRFEYSLNPSVCRTAAETVGARVRFMRFIRGDYISALSSAH